MEEVDEITWEDSPEGLDFSSIGTCDRGFFCIDHTRTDTLGYVLAFANAPMGIVDGKRVTPDTVGELPYTYVAGGTGEDENWARNSAKMRANKHVADDFPEVKQPEGFQFHPALATPPPADTTGETAPADDNAPTPPASSPAGEGHNVPEQVKVRNFIERVERLITEKKEIEEGIKEVYAEAQAYGYDPKVIRELIRLRRFDPERLAEFEGQLSFYRELIGI